MVEGKGLRVTLLHTHLSSSPEAALQRAAAQPLMLPDPAEGRSLEAVSNQAAPRSGT